MFIIYDVITLLHIVATSLEKFMPMMQAKDISLWENIVTFISNMVDAEVLIVESWSGDTESLKEKRVIWERDNSNLYTYTSHPNLFVCVCVPASNYFYFVFCFLFVCFSLLGKRQCSDHSSPRVHTALTRLCTRLVTDH